MDTVSAYPPVLEDIALIVDEDVPAGQVTFLIDQTGGKQVTDVRLFDVYRGEQIGAGKKSLAYSLTYQAEDRTLTDNRGCQNPQKDRQTPGARGQRPAAGSIGR